MKIFRTKPLSLALVFLVFVVSTGCTTVDREKLMEYGGGAIGAVGGAVLGEKIGGRTGQVIGGISGAAAGYWLGGELSQYLDEREEQQAFDAANEVLKNPKKGTVKWKSETNTGVRGSATAIATSQKDCQKIKHRVFEDGQEHSRTVLFCKDPSTGEMHPA
ncbi:MAG: glycine zipper 2TM domain-containing protein [Methylococcaceae bacterium]